MPKQTQVSIRGITNQRLRKYCDANGVSVFNFVDQLCTEFFEKGNETDEGTGNRRPPNNDKSPEKDAKGL